MIVRTYHCPECNHRIEVTLTAEEWEKPPPSCEACDRRAMNQEFKPPAIGGSVRSRAAAITESIIANDYGVANFQSDHRQGATPKVRYKDQSASVLPSDWKATEGHRAVLETAISIGKAHRGRDGLDILKRGLAAGTQVDLIEASKRKAIKVW
jgi:hypothetical protein